MTDNHDKTPDEAALEQRLLDIHKQIQWIADAELRSTWVNGIAANGGLMQQKLALIDETDRILAKLKELNEKR